MPLLFVYGTLAPLDEESANREGWLADAVRGRLYDLGPYPALVGHENPTADWVRGYVRTVTWEQLTGIIDSYEGVAEGLFRRVETTSRDGRVVWVYVFAQSVPPTALGPLTGWNSTKRVCLLPAPGQSQGEP